jgi:hypothetical protein
MHQEIQKLFLVKLGAIGVLVVKDFSSFHHRI